MTQEVFSAKNKPPQLESFVTDKGILPSVTKSSNYKFDQLLQGLEMTGPNEYDFQLPYPDIQEYQYENLSKIGESVFKIKREREEGLERVNDISDLYQHESIQSSH